MNAAFIAAEMKMPSFGENIGAGFMELGRNPANIVPATVAIGLSIVAAGPAAVAKFIVEEACEATFEAVTGCPPPPNDVIDILQNAGKQGVKGAVEEVVEEVAEKTIKSVEIPNPAFDKRFLFENQLERVLKIINLAMQTAI